MRAVLPNGQIIVAQAAWLDANFPGWQPDENQLQPPEPAVVAPQQITRAQGKAALIVRGLWPAVLSYVGAIQDPTEKALAEVALHDTLNWDRSSPTVAATAAALGMTKADLDQLFIQASSIVL